MLNNFTYRKLKMLERKYNKIIRYEEIRIDKGVYKYNYYVYNKIGDFEFKTESFEDLKSTLQLYYD